MLKKQLLWGGAAALVGVLAMQLIETPPSETPPPEPPPESSGLEQGAQALLSRSRQLRDAAASFDQDAALDGLGENARNGFHYRLDDRLEDARVDARPVEGPGDSTGRGYSIDFDGDDPIPMVPRQAAYELEDGELHLRQERRDVLATTDALDIDKETIGAIELRMRVDEGSRARLMWSSKTLASASFAEMKKETGNMFVALVPDGEFHTYRINASTALTRRMEFGSRLRFLALLASDVKGDRVAIDYLRLVPKREKYESVAAGTTSETLGGEMRSTLHVRSPATLTWSMTLPDEGAEMSFGAGVLEAGDPTTFTVSVLVGDDSYEVTSTTVEDNAGWVDHSVDLSAWGGQAVQIRLENQSAQGNIAFWSNPVVHGRSKQRFNVIMVLEDTLRADHLSSYGHDLETSPATDRLAARGVLFKHVVSQAPKTRPSVQSFMTSLLPSATGVWNHQHVLDERYLTLAEILRHQGFATASFVQNSNAGPPAGNHQGFSYAFGTDLIAEGPEHMIADGPQVLDDDLFEWIEGQGDRNFFAYAHVLDPHGVYDPPEEYRHFWKASPGGTPVEEKDYGRYDPEWLDEPTAESRRLLYDGEIAHNDHWFGKLMERLDRLGLKDDTLVVMLSDHGEYFGEHGLWGHTSPAYLQVLRVPLIMSHPTLLPAGQRLDETVQLLDVMPTILDLAGIPTDGLLMQGDSLVSLIEGSKPEYWKSRLAVSEEANVYDNSSAAPRVSGSVFYAENHYLRSQKLPEPLAFDFHADPAEEHPSDAQRVASLSATLDPMMDELLRTNNELQRAITGDAPAVIEYDPDSLDQLQALGYIE